MGDTPFPMTPVGLTHAIQSRKVEISNATEIDCSTSLVKGLLRESREHRCHHVAFGGSVFEIVLLDDNTAEYSRVRLI